MGLGDKLRNAMEKMRNSSALDKESVKEAVKEIQRAMISSDVEVSLVLKLSKSIEEEAFKDLPPGISRKEHIIKKTYDILANALGGENAEIPERPKTILLTGLYGAGKTTTAAKLGKYYQKKGLRVGVIGADTYRPAAYEQLKQLSEKTRLYFYGNPDEKNASKVVEQGLKKLDKCELIIVDSAGRSALDEELVKEIKGIHQILKPEFSFLVLSADIGQIAKKQAIAFHESIGINGVIITKMDGSAKGGGALAACSHTKSPVYFIGVGEQLDDLQEFDAKRYLSKIMGYGDLQGLLEKIKDIEVNEDSMNSMLKGEFNLQMFYDQLQATKQLGPFSKVMDMMGLGSQIPKDALDVGEEKMNSFRTIMDSMTKQEKTDPKVINNSRVERVAKGSGKKAKDVRELIKNYKSMKKMFKEMKGMDMKKMQEGKLNINQLMGKMKKKKKFKFR